MADDANIRWGEKNPSPAQRAMEGHVENAIAKIVGCDRKHIETAMFVEGIRSEFPVNSDDAASTIANAMFGAYRRLAAGFRRPTDIPATIILLGGGPENRAIWRVVSGAVDVLSEIAHPLGVRFGASHVAFMHASCIPFGSNGSEMMNARDCALVDSIIAAGGGYDSLPYGYALRAVCRMFLLTEDDATEASTYWLQGLAAEDERSVESSDVLRGTYRIVDVDKDGEPASRATVPAAEA